ncbi:MAG: MAPEG family protein [Rickettsiales bacterium]
MIAITSFYAALAALFLIFISVNVIRSRYRTRVSIGTSDDRLARAARAQANFTEYVPMILILMAGAELFKVSAYILHLAGIAMMLGRLLHFYSLTVAEPKSGATNFRFRMMGMILTFTTLGILSLILLYVFLMHYTAGPM